MANILVIGSSNTDMVIRAKELPAPGETILGGKFFMNPGGKGANQAVAAARLGGKVTFLTKMGNDIFGNQTVDLLLSEGIDTEYVYKDPDYLSGIAMITVNTRGENSIVVAPGANSNLYPDDIPLTLFNKNSFKILLLQLEIPLESVKYAAQKAKEEGIKVILNPAPACELPGTLLHDIWLLTPNESEAEALSGIRVTDQISAEAASEFLCNRGIENIIITMGEKGSYVRSNDFTGMVPGIKVEAVDTTAAGDVFNGSLAVAIGEGKNLKEAAQFANYAAAISVTRFGAQASIPYRHEI